MQMNNMSVEDYTDCTNKCRLQEHGNLITAVITNHEISDEHLAAFMFKTCKNFREITDEMGRNAVHMAASVGRYRILEWLLNNNAPVNACDYEARNTALHRALFYGAIDCAVLLLRYGANIDATNEDSLTPLLNILRIGDYVDTHYPENNELRVWGSNKNYNLGIGDYESVGLPQPIDFFRKENLPITSVALGNYHSMFLDYKGRLYVVGHGTGGRLGIGVQNSLPVPKLVKTLEKPCTKKVIAVSVSQNHSLVLTNEPAIYASGRNDDFQIGIRGARNSVLSFQQVTYFRRKTSKSASSYDLKGVIACDRHSIAYTTNEIFFWGRVLGQIGYYRPEPGIFYLPEKIGKASSSFLLLVASNNVAVIYGTTHGGSITVNYRYKTTYVKLPQEKLATREPIKFIDVDGGDSSDVSSGSCRALQVLIVTVSDVVYIWRENIGLYYRVIFGQLKINKIDKILCKANKMLILSNQSVYRGKLMKTQLEELRQQNNYSDVNEWIGECKKNVSNTEVIRVDLQRVPYIDRVVDIFCDETYTSFATIQESPAKYFRGPKMTYGTYNFRKLHDTPDFCDLHDVVLHVEGKSFPGHKYIIFERSPGLRKIITNSQTGKDVYINIEGLTAQMFDIVRGYIYMNYLTSGHVGNLIKSCGSDQPFKQTQTLEIFRKHLNAFELPELEESVKWLIQNNAKIWRNPFKRLNRENFPELYDVTILCLQEEQLQAHKCVLVAQAEYFEMMFSHDWSEKDVVDLSTISVNFLEPMINFLYDNGDRFRKQVHSESFLIDMIIYCDQFFINGLRNICEIQLLDKICIGKCGEYLSFAWEYNCELLKEGCMDFICQNLARVLSKRILSDCEPEALKLLNSHYHEMFKKKMDYRKITPDKHTIQENEIKDVVGDFVIDLSSNEFNESGEPIIPKQKNAVEPKSKSQARQYERIAVSGMQQTLEGCRHKETIEKLNTDAENLGNEWIIAGKEVRLPKYMRTELVDVTSAIIEVKKPTLTSETPISPKTYELNLNTLIVPSPKLSQKERKRLSSESSAAPTVQVAATTPVPTKAWASITPPNAADATSILSGPSTSKQAASLVNIIEDEAKQKKLLQRMRNKPLINTQIEEIAIRELRKHYETLPNNFGEVVTVERKAYTTNTNLAQTWLGN